VFARGRFVSRVTNRHLGLMSIRYLSYLLMAVIAGFVVVATQAFTADVAGWIAFGAGIAFALLSVLIGARRGLAHRALGGTIATLGILIVIESLLSSGSTLVWLSFAGSLAVITLARRSHASRALSGAGCPLARGVARTEAERAPRRGCVTAPRGRPGRPDFFRATRAASPQPGRQLSRQPPGQQLSRQPSGGQPLGRQPSAQAANRGWGIRCGDGPPA
jgi:hypothetical protein